jgi:uncharacterized protein YkwD
MNRRTFSIGVSLFAALLAAGCAADGAPVRSCSATQSCGAVIATAAGSGSSATGISGAVAVGSIQAGASGVPFPPTGTSGMAAPSGNAGRGLAGSGGMGGRATTPAGRGGGSGAAGTTAGSAGTSTGSGDFEAERVACVDYINMYRATRMLAPLKRGSAAQEACSDKGAKKDGDSMSAHSSAGDCYSQQLFAQNTCPGYPLRGGTVTSALTGCLDQMWGEGEPPQGSEACKQDQTGCYPKYGHWINMTDPAYKSVVCSFYKMSNGSYWMNQNFGN